MRRGVSWPHKLHVHTGAPLRKPQSGHSAAFFVRGVNSLQFRQCLYFLAMVYLTSSREIIVKAPALQLAPLNILARTRAALSVLNFITLPPLRTTYQYFVFAMMINPLINGALNCSPWFILIRQ
jgi:hypothetical protein